MQKPKVDPTLIRTLWAQELTDLAIARRLGLNRHTVRKWLRRAGCAARGPKAPAVRQAKRLALSRQLASAGLPHLRAARLPEGWAALNRTLASDYGLPAGLRPVQVAVVIALAAGPLTTRELAAALGRAVRRKPIHAFQAPRCPGGNYLPDLRRRGLVGMSRQTRGGGGQAEGLWFLTTVAMDLLTKAKEDSHANPVP